MALLWHKESGTWKDRTDALSFKNGGAWGKRPTYYKHDGQWELLKNSVVPSDIVWTLEDLTACSDTTAFNSLVTSTITEGLAVNTILSAQSYDVSPQYGVCCAYGTSDSAVGGSVVFATNYLPCFSRIKITASVNVAKNTVFAFLIYLIDESNTNRSLFRMYKSAYSGLVSYAQGYKKSEVITISNDNLATAGIKTGNLDFTAEDIGIDREKKYKLVMKNTYKYKMSSGTTYTCPKVYLGGFEVYF